MVDTTTNSSDNDGDNNTSSNNGDFVQVHVDKMIQGIRKFLNPQYGNTTPDEEADAVIKVNPAIKKYAELKIKILHSLPPKC